MQTNLSKRRPRMQADTNEEKKNYIEEAFHKQNGVVSKVGNFTFSLQTRVNSLTAKGIGFKIMVPTSKDLTSSHYTY